MDKITNRHIAKANLTSILESAGKTSKEVISGFLEKWDSLVEKEGFDAVVDSINSAAKPVNGMARGDDKMIASLMGSACGAFLIKTEGCIKVEPKVAGGGTTKVKVKPQP